MRGKLQAVQKTKNAIQMMAAEVSARAMGSGSFGSIHLAICDLRLSSSDSRLAICDWRFAICRFAIRDLGFTICGCDLRLATIRVLRFAICDLRFAIYEL
eukprot:4949090-Alexandrium_andersonii.AAC.2